MTGGPYSHAFSFWKPLVGEDQLDALAEWASPGQSSPRRVSVWRSAGPARHYRVDHDGTTFSLFAAVHPIDTVPESAQAVATIADMNGNHHSFVLWYPETSSAVIPFDTNAAAEAMWWERHVSQTRRTVLPGPVLAAYYSVKPLFPSSAKQWLRRQLVKRIDRSASFLGWPSDSSLDHLMRLQLLLALKTMGESSLPFMWFWPDGHSWATVLTHDVETAGGVGNVHRVMEIERERGLRSSFNFVPRDYEVSGSLLEGLKCNGFEVGVHGYTHDNLMFSKWSTFTKRAAFVNEIGRAWEAVGFRSPATYRNLDWFDHLEFEYDSSVADTAPFEPQPGGCGSVFPYLVGGMVELPMTVPQDHTLFSLLQHADSSAWLDKLAQIERAHGMACMLTHPDPAAGYIGRSENESHYCEVLDYVRDAGSWTPLPREMARWWRTRSAARAGCAQQPPGASTGTAVLDASGGLAIVAPRG